MGCSGATDPPMPRHLTAELVVDRQCELAECPTWHTATATLWWTDIHGRALHRFDPARDEHDEFALAERLGSFAFTDGGRLLAAFVAELGYLTVATGEWEPLAPIEAEVTETRANDGRPDRHGGFVFGTMHETTGERRPHGCFYGWRAGAALVTLRPGIGIANSVSFSPDGYTIYYTDTPGRVIWRAAYDPEGPALSGEASFLTIDGPGAPDGSTVDADGCLWNAQWGASQVARYTPTGVLDTVIDLPVPHVSAPVFGGPDLTTLYITTAREHLDPSHPAWDVSGSIFAVDLAGVAVGIPDTLIRE